MPKATTKKPAVKAAKPIKTKVKSKFNFWIPLSILLIIALGGVVAYDRSAFVHNGINGILGIEDNIFPVIEQVKVEVLTDKSIQNPSYDINQQLDQIDAEFNIDLIVSEVDINDEKGKKYIEDYSFVTVPIVLFDENLNKTDFYKEAESYFTKQDKKYVLHVQPLKYLSLPKTDDGYSKGTANPKVTIIEYSSFSCPYCSQMTPVLYKLLAEYPNDLKLVYKHFDRGGVDPVLENASECAGEQNKFWEMHDYIFENQSSLAQVSPPDFLTNAATNVGLNIDEFNKCVEEVRYGQKIKDQTNEAINFGISGTPSFFINDEFIGGAVSYDSLKTVIDSFIK